MNNKYLTKKMLIAFITIFLSACIYLCSSISYKLYAKGADELIETFNVAIDEQHKNNNMSCIKITPLQSDAKIDLVNKISGDFKISFSFENTDINFVEFKIQNINTNDKFSIVAEKNDITYNIYVKTDYEKTGIYYESGHSVSETKNMNDIGQYTKIIDSVLNLSFNPEKMEISVNDLVVWDFSKKVNDLKRIETTLDSMEEYNVSIDFGQVTDSNSMYVYSLMGEKMGSPVIFDKKGPEIFSNINKNIVTGTNYKIPKPYTFDFINGNVKNLKVKIDKIVDYVPVPVLEKTNYADNLSVGLYDIGNYVITYFAQDGANNETIKEYGFKVVNASEKIVFNNTQADLPSIVGKNSSIIIPNVTYSNSLFIDNGKTEEALLTIKKDGQVYENYTSYNVSSEEIFVFSQAGNYKFIYNAPFVSQDILYELEVDVREDYPSLEYSNLNKEYKIGTTISGESLSSTLDSVTKNATSSLKYPNGTLVKGESFKFSSQGHYTLSYSVIFNSKKYTYERSFTVVEQLFSVKGPSEDKIDYSTSNYVDKQGINFVLKSDDVFTYNRIIDLNDNTDSDSIMELYVAPFISGQIEANTIDIRLTDVSDPNNYIEIRSYAFWKMPEMSYMSAGVKSNRKVGWDSIYLRTVPESGTISNASHAGIDKSGKHYPINFSFDVKTNKIYMLSGTSKTLVSDLSSNKEHGEVFEGFSTNEVYLSIKVSEYTKNTANFFLTSIDGKQIDGLYSINDNSPEIAIDFVNYDINNIPYAETGKKYELFSAKSFDKIGNEYNISKKVYYNYGLENQYNISINDNGFVPLYAGDYTVVYSAVTNSGTIIVKKYIVEAKTNLTDINFEINLSGGDIVVGEKTSLKALNISNISGNTKVEISYISPTNKQGSILNSNFIPQEIGLYKIIFKVTDYINRTAEKQLTIDVKQNNYPVFDEKVNLPKYFYYGENYFLPQLTAFDYTNGKTQIPVVISVKQGLTETIINDSGEFTPNLANEKVTVIYKAIGVLNEKDMTFEVPVKVLSNTDSFGDIVYNTKEFFIGENIEVSSTNTGINIESLRNGAYVDYLYPLSSQGFNFKFNVGVNNGTANNISIILSDFENPKISLKLEFTKAKDNQNSNISLNGGSKIEIPYSLSGLGNDFFIKYNVGSNVITDDANYSIEVDRDLNNAKFKGFPSNRVNLRIVFNNDNSIKLNVKSINYQTFGANLLDEVAPSIFVGQYETKFIPLGTELALKDALALDVLDKQIKFTITGNYGSEYVKTVDGLTIRNIDVKNYKIKFDRIGSYNFVFKAVDRSGNEESAYLAFTVLDETTPEISLSANKVVGKVGKAISLPSASVIDNVSKDLKIVVMVINSDQVVTSVNNNVFTPQKVGIYTIRYVSIDEAGNVAKIDIPLEVK